MITDKEQNATLLSATNKDYYTTWQELLEVAGKLSERWIPESTNETDPGIVLLKVLTACADKLNYNIDKNILEAFMPSAAQEESMRKLCEMMGYSMKYYQAATTVVTIAHNSDSSNIITTGELTIPKSTTFTNVDNDITYVSLADVIFNSQDTLQTVTCIEGELKYCEDDNNNIVSISNIDDNYRYYLPTSNVAENGIFIYNYNESKNGVGDEWTKVDNLNVQALTKRYYTFGYDSKELCPYIQFPDDISSLIEDGLIISYIVTNGINGNISSKAISTFALPEGWSSTESSTNNTTGVAHTVDEFNVYNATAATNGQDPESLTDAYLNFKKTVGTFNTLITCRDYMNKIYELTVSTSDTTNLVSNIVVSDIRDDINKSITICSFNDFGISYIDSPLTYKADRTVTTTSGSSATFSETYNAIDNFQLVLYPFKKIYGTNTKNEYKNSFKYDKSVYNDIKNELSALKTISHNLILPSETTPAYENFADIVAIKNYLKLNAKITTTAKITDSEYSEILTNIKTAIYKNFNSRNLDFGEAIPFDSIETTIESADTRIKNVYLDEPSLYTTFLLADNNEYNVASTTSGTETQKLAKQIYNKLALRNILAGRLALFNYNTNFTPAVTETKNSSYELIYPTTSDPIKYMTSKLVIDNIPETATESTNIVLKDNQIVQFRAPNLKTTTTYSTYTNYYLHLANPGSTNNGIPATFITLYEYMANNNFTKFETFMNATCKSSATSVSSSEAASYIEKYGCVFTRTGSEGSYIYTAVTAPVTGTTYYIYPLASEIAFLVYHNWIKTQEDNTITLSGLYKSLGLDLERVKGKMVDKNYIKYQACTTYITSSTAPFASYFVQQTHATTETGIGTDFTADGFGKDPVYSGIEANEEYKLQAGDYLCINYTSSTASTETSDSGDSTISTEAKIVNYCYKTGTIIKPNIALIDSETKRSAGSSYQKTDGFDFSTWITDTIPGMYSLGSNEQIEIRALDQTFVYDNTPVTGKIYVYFKLNNEEADSQDKVTFLTAGASTVLQEGEYFWYTDRNKATLNYWGNGCEIINKTGVDICKTADDITTEALLEEGLDIIPWIPLTGLTVSDITQPGLVSTDKYIQMNTYQYITLVASDTIKQITFSGSGTSLTPDWVACSSASYIVDSEEGTLPKLSFSTDTAVIWKARTKLAINAGPNTVQTLHCESYDTNGNDTSPKCTESIHIFKAKPTSNIYATSTTEDENYLKHFSADKLSFKTNYALDTTEDLVKTWYSDDVMNDFEIKVFNDNTIYVAENDSTKKTALVLNNMSSYFTSFSFTNGVQNQVYTTLHCAIPDKDLQYALLMIYYSTATETVSDLAHIIITDSTDSTPKIFNNYNSAATPVEIWWEDYTTSGKYYLKPKALNVLKLTNNCDIKICCGSDKNDVIIFSPLRLVDFTTDNLGINNSLIQYQAPESNISAEKQLLNDIKVKDPDFKFFYNAVIDTSLSMNINTYAGENLATENIWYDYNNINNKFVISEIDADWLDSGIILASTSKKFI